MKNLFWLDLEMTGLQPDRDKVLEACVVVTDWSFKELYSWSTAIYQPPEVLALMDDWCQKTHGASGLLSRVPQGVSESFVDEKFCSIVNEFFSADERVVLCGNSIGQDRKFVDCYFKNFAKKLHYRMLDVSSFKVVFENKFGLRYEKKNKHSAEEDVRESIAELQHYLSFFAPYAQK